KDVAKAFEVHPSSESSEWFGHASLQLYAGDLAGYRRAAARLFEQFDNPGPRTGWWIVCTCTLGPSGVAPERLVQVAGAAPRVDPQGLPYRLWLGAAQYRAGRFEQALRTLEEVTRSGDGWTNSEAWPLLAMVHHRLGHAVEARRWLDRTRRAFDQAVWSARGDPFTPLLDRRNDFDLLAVYLLHREAGELLTGSPIPDHPLRWVVQGRGYASLGQFDRALASFTRAIELRPEDPTLWVARAWFHAGQARWHQAEADFARASALPPPDRPGAHWDWHSHALCRLYLDQTEGYRLLCRQTLQHFGRVKDPWPAQQLALLCFLAPDAVPDLNVPAQLAELALASDPWNPWFLLTLGAARHRTGFPAEAV